MTPRSRSLDSRNETASGAADTGRDQVGGQNSCPNENVKDLTRINHDHDDDADWLRRHGRSLPPGRRSVALLKAKERFSGPRWLDVLESNPRHRGHRGSSASGLAVVLPSSFLGPSLVASRTRCSDATTRLNWTELPKLMAPLPPARWPCHRECAWTQDTRALRSRIIDPARGETDSVRRTKRPREAVGTLPGAFMRPLRSR